MTFYRAFLLVCALSLVGCSFKKDGSERGAAFEVSPVTLESSPETMKANAFGLPKQRRFLLKTCITDKATANRRVGDDFTFLAAKGPTPSLTNDNEGCVHWAETVDFAPLAKESRVTFARTLLSGKSKVPLRYALNPWATDSTQLIDLTGPGADTESIVPEDQAPLALRGEGEFAPERPNLYFDRYEYESLEEASDAGSTTLALEVAFTGGAAIRRRLDGSPHRLPLVSGPVSVALQLLEYLPGVEKPIVLGEAPVTTPQWRQGVLQTTAHFVLKHARASESVHRIAFHISSPGPAEGLSERRGEFSFVFKSGRQSGTPTLFENLPREVSRDVSYPESRQPIGFYAKDWKVSFAGDSRFNTANWVGASSGDIEVCVVSSASGEPILNHPFFVGVSQDSNEIPKKPLKSDARGCLTWNEVFRIPVTATKEDLKRWVHIRSERSPYVKLQRTIAFELEPYLGGPFFVRDTERYGEKSDSGLSAPRLWTKGGIYQFERDQFEIVNKQLDLRIHKGYHFTLNGDLQRDNTADRGNTGKTGHLPVGTRVKIISSLVEMSAISELVADPEIMVKNFIAGFQTETTVRSEGQIAFTQNFPIHFTTVPSLSTRTHIILAMIPVGEGSLPAPTVFIDQFDPGAWRGLPGFKGDLKLQRLEVVDQEVLKLMTEMRGADDVRYLDGTGWITKQSAWTESPIELLAKYWDLYLPVRRVMDDQAAKPTERVIRQQLSEKKLISRALTETLLREACGGNDDCQRNLWDYFQTYQFTAVDDILSKEGEVISGAQPSFTMSARFMREFARSDRQIEGQRAQNQASLGLTVKFGYEHYGNGATVHSTVNHQREAFSAQEATFTDDTRSGWSLFKNLNIDGGKVTLGFRAKVLHCFFVRPLLAVRHVMPTTSVLLCADPQEDNVQESWTTYRERLLINPSSLLDQGSKKLMGWTTVLRGDRPQEEFEKALKDPARMLSFHEVNLWGYGIGPSIDANFTNPAAINSLKRDGGISPGIVDFREGAATRWSEPQIVTKVRGCVEKTLAPIPVTQRTEALDLQARLYCRCVYDSAAKKWEFDAFGKLREEGPKALQKDHTFERCDTFAGREVKGG